MAAETTPAPLPGERVMIGGQEYLVTRLTVQTKSKTHVMSSRDRQMVAHGIKPDGEPTRAQIDLIPVAEAERRLESLRSLLAGEGGEAD